MSVPEIFTETPVESIIISSALKIQTVLAEAVIGTPLLRNIGILFIVFLIIKCGVDVFSEKKTLKDSVIKIISVILLYLISMTMLSKGTSSISFNSLGSYGSGNRTWNSYRKVNEIKDSGNLSNTSALYWYATINSGIQEISNMISKAVSSVFTDNG